jgi:pyruvate-formate lyase-activating enzyme
MYRTRRVKVVTGLKCNIRCVFCYYRDSLDAPNRSLARIQEDIAYAYRRGVREIDFSGGEPTVHPDLPLIITKAKEAGIQRVCIISNGWRLADVNYLKLLKSSGLDEILFSLHGPNEEIHDRITDTPGSFRRMSEALGHAADEGLVVRTNTVVNRLNYSHLRELCVQIAQYHPAQVNFITINDWCYAKNIIGNLMVSYSEMAPQLREACDFLGPSVPAVNVRYIPFCFMEGYERFVCNHRQVPFDRYEWVPRVRARIEEGTGLLRYLGILGYGMVLGGAWRRLCCQPFATTLDDCVTEGLRRHYYAKGPRCSGCRYRELCDGVEKTYAREYGFKELTPARGEGLRDPIHFRSSWAHP